MIPTFVALALALPPLPPPEPSLGLVVTVLRGEPVPPGPARAELAEALARIAPPRGARKRQLVAGPYVSLSRSAAVRLHGDRLGARRRHADAHRAERPADLAD